VRAVLTAADLAPMIHGSLSATMFLGSPIAKLRPLADGDVCFAGEAVAMVIADSRYLAEDACELVEVSYQILDPILDPELAAGDTVNLVHPDRPSNVMQRQGAEHPELDEVLAGAAHVVTATFHQYRQSQVPMEPHGVVVSWDPFGNELRIWCSSQRVHEVRATTSRVTGLAEHRIRATQRDVGGGFGQKGSMRTEEIAVVLAAYNLGIPLKWIEDRRENLIAGGHARADRVTVTMGVDDSGRILGVRLITLRTPGRFPPAAVSAVWWP
jgi:carbon-monoxide dehydrogenase large subunit